MRHGVGQDGCMMNLTKASNITCALYVLPSAPVCVCGGGRGVPLSRGNKEHPRNWLAPCQNPNPVTISP